MFVGNRLLGWRGHVGLWGTHGRKYLKGAKDSLCFPLEGAQ
jgi:hypothetical protein